MVHVKKFLHEWSAIIIMAIEEAIINIEETDSDSVCEIPEVEWIPCVDIQFDSEEVAYDFYNEYGGRVGFSIRREYKNNSRKDEKVTSRNFVCSKEGKRGEDKRDRKTKNRRAETRTDCRARMLIAFNMEFDKYIVKDFKDTHNHPLISEECAHMMPLQRKIKLVQAIDMELAADCGIPIRKAFELSSRQAGGRESIGFTKVYVQNYIRMRRQNDLELGDANWLINYFQTQCSEDLSFFYAMQLDSDVMITNIFWADSKMISDYGHFGDVVTFDTTYKLVHGNRPFAVFLGLNHHREIVVFGLAFMYDETTDSFGWLFNTFLKAMSHKAPSTILNDQDTAMVKALVQVMPDIKHLLCTWHLMRNAQKNLGNLSVGEKGIKSEISKLMYEIEGEEEFLVEWALMEKEFAVENNNWLANLFGLKHVWAKAYVKHVWSAGMRTTQLTENFNTRLKQWTRNGKDGRVEDILGSDVITDPRLEIKRRHKILYRYLTEISVIASVSEEGFNNVLGAEIPVEFLCSDECYMPTCSTQGHDWDNSPATYFGQPMTPLNNQGVDVDVVRETNFSPMIQMPNMNSTFEQQGFQELP
ncbi:protein FAR1-RELATED SEQUENCE 5-like [Cornus florida]|uniref:protein FAR1-RELATED SEQUENCE 5-like n=1 Tax=Cornus florida TaxID=4283 RepID=UPI0028991D9D|nr:protein FAR1-RELATED SEQUENCE 5-like [Cornus florida]